MTEVCFFRDLTGFSLRSVSDILSVPVPQGFDPDTPRRRGLFCGG